MIRHSHEHLIREDWKARRINLLAALRSNVCVLRLVLRNAETLLGKPMVPQVLLDVLKEDLPDNADPFDGRYDRRLKMAAEIGISTVIGLHSVFLRAPELTPLAGDIPDFVDHLAFQIESIKKMLSEHYRAGVELFEHVKVN